MIGWIWRLLVGKFNSCDHEWETIESSTVQRREDNTRIGKSYVLRCKKCGEMKKKCFNLVF